MNHSIEILGQKMSYPTTWQGMASVLFVCLTIGFLGHTLDGEKIDSYASIINGATEEAYGESLNTIDDLNRQISSLQSTIADLTEKAQLAEEEKVALFSQLESENKSRQTALENLSQLNTARISKFTNYEQKLPVEEKDKLQGQVYAMQQQQIQKQLGTVKLQQNWLGDQQQKQQQKSVAE